MSNANKVDPWTAAAHRAAKENTERAYKIAKFEATIAAIQHMKENPVGLLLPDWGIKVGIGPSNHTEYRMRELLTRDQAEKIKQEIIQVLHANAQVLAQEAGITL